MNLKYDLKSYLNYISDDEENQNYIKQEQEILNLMKIIFLYH